MTQNKSARIAALTAQTQQTLVQARRQIDFAAVQVIHRLPKGNLKELQGGTQPLPQLSSAGIGTPRFRGGEAFDGEQGGAQGTAKFELLSLSIGAVRQQRQLLQCFLQLRGGFRHRRAGGGPITGLAPVGDGFFNQPGLCVMLREKLGLAVHNLRQPGFKRSCDLRV